MSPSGRRVAPLRGGKHHDHDAGCLGFDHVFDSGGAARHAPGGHRRGCPGRACRPGRTHRPRRTGQPPGRTLGHGRGTWPGARRAVAWLRPGHRQGRALMPPSGP